VQRVLHHVGQRAREQRAVDRHIRQIGGRLHVDGDPVREPRPVGLDHFFNQRRKRRRFRPRRGRRRKARELGGDLAQQLDLREDGVDAVVEYRRQRAPAIDVHAPRVLGGELDRRQRVLDLVRHLPRHVGPRFQPLCALELGALPLQIGRHLVEVFDQAAQLVG